MCLRAWYSLLCALHVSSQLHPMARSVQYIFAGRYSSVLMEGYSGSELQKGSMIKWSLVLRGRSSLMVLHVIGSPDIRYSDYYIHRINYNTGNGSLTLNNIDLDDRGIYVNIITTYGETVKKSSYMKILDVRDVLIAPVIIQNPKNAVGIAQLTCVANSWDTDTILWYKGSKLLENDEIYSMPTDNRTLTIKTDQVANCELFTCVIENKVSQSKNSHVLVINGLLLLHQYSFITSIIALVSTSTSFAASIFIIFFALGTYRVHKRHAQLTAVFVLFQLLSFISLLTAALFCLCNPDFPIPYKIIDGLGLLLAIAVIIYILVLYLHPKTRIQKTFLIQTNHRYSFLVYGSLSVIISATPIYRGQNNIKACQYPISQTSGNAISAAVVYVFILGLILILFTKYMNSWNQVQKLSRGSLR